jgi:glycine cleavage system H lipoate-binding protein
MYLSVCEFQWSAGPMAHLVACFAGFTAIAMSVGRKVRTSSIPDPDGRGARMQWRAKFDGFPETAKQCRHALTGELAQRSCPHGFACGECDLHPRLQRHRTGRDVNPARPVNIRGIAFPLDRLYHRAHTWVGVESDGTCTIGLDAFASRIIGTPEAVTVPCEGTRLTANEPACTITKKGRHYPVLSPVDGTVVSSGGTGDQWWVRLKPDAPPEGSANLLRGIEIGPWIVREMDRVEMMASGQAGIASLADGGELLPELGGQLPEVMMHEIRAGVLYSG